MRRVETRRWGQLGVVGVLSLVLLWSLGACLTRPAQGTDPAPGITPTATLYVPLITRSPMNSPLTTLHVITVPVESVVALNAWGPDHTAAFAPDGNGAFGDAGDWLSTYLAPNDYGGTYLSRTYLEMSLPTFEDRVLSATLNLVACTAWDTLGPPLPPATVTVHAGSWGESLRNVRSTTLWGAWEEPTLGQLATTYDPSCWDGETETWTWCKIPLPIDAVASGISLHLVLRDSEDHVDLRATYPHGSRSVYHPPAAGPVYLKLWVEVTE